MVEIKINIKIPSAKVNDFKEAFKKVVVTEHLPPEYQGLTDLQLLKAYLKDHLFAIYKTGKMKIAADTTPPEVDLNILEVT